MPEYQLQFTAGFRRTASRLFEQQMWCWGQDIRHKEGNLLISYGFERHRAIHDADVSSCYHLPQLASRRIVLWGFGAYAGDEHGGVYLHRQSSGFQPLYNAMPLAPPQGWFPPPEGERPCTSETCIATCNHIGTLMRWIGSYERWLVDRGEAVHRQRSLQAWKRKPVAVANEIPDKWLELATLCDEATIVERAKRAS